MLEKMSPDMILVPDRHIMQKIIPQTNHFVHISL